MLDGLLAEADNEAPGLSTAGRCEATAGSCSAAAAIGTGLRRVGGGNRGGT